MKALLFFLIIALSIHSGFSQSDSILKFIFVPHPRSENKQQQSVLPAIEKIDFSKYDMILLGGDITWNTSFNRVSMDYCDSLFDLGSPNTLWSMGNHDLDHPALIEEYTGRPTYYSYYRDGITFLVLDTEQDAFGFQNSFISGDQLDMIKNVCDTINKSNYLVVLHGRLLWMIGNNDFTTRIDSVAESTKQLDTTNFYQEVYPLLQNAKNKGVKVICLGGDKSKINIEYSPEDSITFLTSTMAPEFADSVNDVMVLTYSRTNKKITWDFVPLDKVVKKTQNPASVNYNPEKEPAFKVWKVYGSTEICIQQKGINSGPALIQIFSINGILCNTIKVNSNEIRTLSFNRIGIFIIRVQGDNYNITEKIVVL